MKPFLSAFLISVFLVGCSSGVQRPSEPHTRVNLSDKTPLSSVSINLTKEAKKKAIDNLKFNQHRLLDHIKRALEAHSLLEKSPGKESQELEILVKDMRVRSNFSAIAFGFMAGADSVTGDIVLKDSLGSELDRFEVSVSYALGGLGGGQDEARMGWLYEKFAEETVNELIGKKRNEK